jgi:transposase InsO family protein
MDQEEKMDLALWRYGIISPLLHRQADEINMVDLLENLAGRSYVRPDGTGVILSAETMRKWLYRYHRGGLPALANKERSDKGRYDVSAVLSEAIFRIRREHPRWTTALLLKNLTETGLWNGLSPSRSSLYRFATAHNLRRDPHLKPETACRAFTYTKFGQLWIADFLHGPKLKVGKQKNKTHLHAIIDDSSRYIVSAGFYLGETVESLIGELMKACRNFGLPQRLYTDNGAAYASRHLKIAAARLGVHLIHTPVRRPQGRAKVERFFKTVREQLLLASEHFQSLDQMNSALAKWLAEYHQRTHRTLNLSPLQKRLSGENVCRRVPEVADMEALFRMERRCRVYKDGTIRLKTRIFEVPGCLPGQRTTVYYTPWDMSRVYYGDDMRLAQQLDPVQNALRFTHPVFSTEKEEDHDR